MWWLWARLCLLNGGVYFTSRLLFNRFHLRRSQKLHLLDQLSNALNWIPLSSNAGNLVPCSVGATGVGHGVPVVAVGIHLHHQRTVLNDKVFGKGNRLFDRKDVHSIDLNARDVISSLEEARLLGTPRLGCSHSVVVVLAHVDDRQVPQSSHVQGFETLALVSGTISVHGKGAVGFLVVLLLEGDPDAEGNLRANNAVSPVEVVLPVVHVHGASDAVGATVSSAQKLGN